MLVDSHAHLEMPEFLKDLEEVVLRAKKSGVEYIFTVGQRKDWKRALEIARSYPKIYAILVSIPTMQKRSTTEPTRP